MDKTRSTHAVFDVFVQPDNKEIMVVTHFIVVMPLNENGSITGGDLRRHIRSFCEKRIRYVRATEVKLTQLRGVTIDGNVDVISVGTCMKFADKTGNEFWCEALKYVKSCTIEDDDVLLLPGRISPHISCVIE